MAKDSKLNTFGGVYTPSLLTILGVIMYLRLPWVIGNAGLYWGLGIILVAHVISISTGLSISSIATDKNVGAGGPYYIISRSLGLPIGGALGAALFIGLSFSISLYVIGFSESFLDSLGLPASKNAIRLVGTLALLLITTLTFFSTAVAIKSQYFILGMIVVSLAAVFGGAPPPPTAPPLSPLPTSPSNAVLFGIFFPAVTGFAAGVNMSGDLRDPRHSIPKGTLAAIGTGLIVYVSLAVFVGLRIDRTLLIDDPNVLKRIAWSPPLLVAGIWGATLSSALGSVLGAPRILQALAVDRIAPRWFSRGYGKTNEPRNALVLAFALGEAGILIAELDSIARVVSMVFLTMYGFLNLSCFIESWASPDFRPAFRIPKTVSLIGACTSVVVMILLDLPAMLGATALMVAIFLVLKRKQLTLDSGDTWEGVWSSLIRSGLYRLAQVREQHRNWRPNVLLFRPAEAESAALRRFGEALAAEDGHLTDIGVIEHQLASASMLRGLSSPRLGIIQRELVTSDFSRDVLAAARFHGFGQLSPNALLFPATWLRERPEEFFGVVTGLADLDLNVLIFSEGKKQPATQLPRIDVWWRPGAGSLRLSIALLRFITRTRQWERAGIRFLLVSTDVGQQDTLKSSLRRHLRVSRLEASIRAIRAETEQEALNLIGVESADAGLVLVGVPERLDTIADLARALPVELHEQLGPTLAYRSSSAFSDVVTTPRHAPISLPPPNAAGETLEPAPLPLPATPELARIASQQAEVLQTWLSALHVDGCGQLYASNIKLIRRIREIFERHWNATSRALERANPRKRRNLLNRAQSSILNEWRDALDEQLERTLTEQQDILEGRLNALLEDETLVDTSNTPHRIERRAEDFAPSAEDGRWLRRFKRRHRIVSWLLRRRHPIYLVQVASLQRYHRYRALSHLVPTILARWASDSHRLAAKLGRLLHDAKTSPALFGQRIDDERLAEALGVHGQGFIRALLTLEEKTKEQVQRVELDLLLGVRQIAEAFALDLDRLDLALLMKRERRLPRHGERQLVASLGEYASRWAENQKALLVRAALGLRVSSVQHRLGTIAEREKQLLMVSLRSHTLAECLTLLKRLDEVSADLSLAATTAKELRPFLDLAPGFDADESIDRLFRDSAELLSELPEMLSTLTDDCLDRLEMGESDVGDREIAEFPLRRLVQYVIEANFVAEIQAALAPIAPAERHAIDVVHEVVRLVTYHLGELAVADDSSMPLLESQAVPVLGHARQRVLHEIETLREYLHSIEHNFDSLHAQVIERTNSCELGRTASSLDQHLRLQQGRKAVFGTRAVLQRVAARVQDASVSMLYRRSAGQVLALRWQAGSTQNVASLDEVRSIVDSHSPKPETYDSLPFYYRQLFLGQTAINDSFWIGRTELLQRGRRAIQRLRQGATGALLIVGERGSGKTALCHRLVSENGLKSLVVHAPAGGTGMLEDFELALCKSTGRNGDTATLLAGLPKQSVLIVDDLELWWERVPDGLRVLKHILELVRTQSQHCHFILTISQSAYEFLSLLLPIGDHAIAILQCGPLGAKELQQIITMRHGATGLPYQLSGKPPGKGNSTWAQARLFTQHFDFSRGNVGSALRAWITHIDRFAGNQLYIRPPRAPNWSRLDSMNSHWSALIVELLLHRQMSAQRLCRVVALEQPALETQLDGLLRSGLLLEPRPGIFELNSFLVQGVAERFRAKGIIR